MSEGVVTVFDSHGVLSHLQNPLCHMSTILGASWMGRERSPGALTYHYWFSRPGIPHPNALVSYN